MPIFTKVDNQVREIKNAIVKIGGQVISTCPLRAKIDGMIVDFIQYMNGNSLIKVSPDNFSSSALNKLLESLNGVVSSLVVVFEAGEFNFTSTVGIGENVSLVGSDNTVFTCSQPLEMGMLWLKCANDEVRDIIFEYKGFSNEQIIAIYVSPEDFSIVGKFTRIEHCTFKECGIPIKVEEAFNVTISESFISNGSRPDMCELIFRRCNYVIMEDDSFLNTRFSIVSSNDVSICSCKLETGEIIVEKERNGGRRSQNIALCTSFLETIDIMCSFTDLLKITGNKLKRGTTINATTCTNCIFSSNTFYELASATPPIILENVSDSLVTGNVADLDSAHTFCVIDEGSLKIKLIANNVTGGTLVDDITGGSTIESYFNVK